MTPPKYRLRFEIAGAYAKSSNEFLSAEETLNDYQVIEGYDVTEEISIDRLKGAVIEEISLRELEWAVLRENPSCVLLAGRKDLTSGFLFPMYD